MNALLTLLSLALCSAIALFLPEDGAPATLVCAFFATIVGFIIARIKTERQLLLRLFVSGLLIRMAVGTGIYYFQLQDFFGGDAKTYDQFGWALLKGLAGDKYYLSLVSTFMVGEGYGGGWGILYLVAAVYSVIGRNMLAVQFINAVIGAATAPIIFLCALHIFSNTRVSRITAYFVTFFPSLVLWSSQGLKDGPVVFLLAVSILATLKLGDRFSPKYFVILVCALFGLLTLRFYVFYMMVAAVSGAFIIGMRAVTTQTFLRQFVIIIGLGLAFTYLGVLRYAEAQLKTYGNLEAVQRSRLDAAEAGKSGFAKDVDVSTTSGAIAAIPFGMAYLMLAPFPWQITSLRQSITLPEMIVWWACFPILILGFWFTIKYRLRRASPILFFTTMLSLVYSVFQGNVGTAYRQRSQLLIFYFIFIAVGLVLLRERREERTRKGSATRQGLTEKQAAAARPRHKDTGRYSWE